MFVFFKFVIGSFRWIGGVGGGGEEMIQYDS